MAHKYTPHLHDFPLIIYHQGVGQVCRKERPNVFLPHPTMGCFLIFFPRKSATTPQRAMQPDHPTHYPQPFHILFTNPLHLRDSYAVMRFHAEQYHCVLFIQQPSTHRGSPTRTSTFTRGSAGVSLLLNTG